MEPAWRQNQDAKGIVWLILDVPESRVNILDPQTLSELEDLLHHLPNPTLGMVIQSGKSTGFIAGADVKQFVHAEQDLDKAKAFLEQGQRTFALLENLPFSVVVVIDGFCLGGGLELALACDYRIAIDQPKTKLGFPEVRLGVQPGWGGTVRFPSLVGPILALSWMVSAKNIGAQQAKKVGLVDYVVLKRHLKPAIDACLSRGKVPHPKGIRQRVLNQDWLRPVIAAGARRSLRQKVNPNHYPAPFALIDSWAKSSHSNPTRAYQAEIDSILNLMQGKTAQNLVRTFFLQERLKGEKVGSSISAPQIQRVHVVGSGRMGGDIAAWAALQGFQVNLFDENRVAVGRALSEAKSLFQHKLKDPYAVRLARDRLVPDVLNTGMEHADLIIEAIPENLSMKRAVFQEAESRAKPEAILATNTSTIPLEEIAQGLTQGSRLVGIHFFNPVAAMPLVEIVESEQTQLQTVASAVSWVKKLGKLPLRVKSRPGFLVNRLLIPYLLESARLFEEGIAPEVIDQVAVDHGMSMGPLTLMDMVGLDVCWMAAQNVVPQASTLPSCLRDRVEQGILGKKTNQGFYSYRKDYPNKSVTPYSQTPPEDLWDRLWVPIWNEAESVLAAKIVPDRGIVDAGLIFGAGFPPFTGGLLEWVYQNLALAEAKRQNLCTRYGTRFSHPLVS